MKLTKSEEAIRTALERGPLDADGIAAILYEGRERPKFWRSSVSARMRYLRLKTIADSRPVVRSSSLGRGRKAEYALGGEPSREDLARGRAEADRDFDEDLMPGGFN